MKRFIALCALTVAPFALKADMQGKSGMGSDDMFVSATSAANETWSDRTGVSAAFTNSKRPLWDVFTIQPIYRTEGTMMNTVFVQGDFGFQKWDSPQLSLGLGYRRLAASNDYMYGANLFYDHEWDHSHNNVGTGLEWFGRFFTIRMNYNFRVHDHKGHMKEITHYFGSHHTTGNLDLDFQLPYLPWTLASFGPTWHHDREHKGEQSHHWKYALRMNLAGPVALEAGFGRGWGQGGYVKLAVNFGRAAFAEHTLSDAGIIASEAFTARDLKNYTLETVGRFGWIR